MELKKAKAKAKEIVDTMKIKVMEMTDKAKDKAKLCIDKAKDKSKKCLDKTKAKQIIEDSKKKAKEIIAIAKEKGVLALKKAKIKSQQCIDKSNKKKGGDGGHCDINEYVSFTPEAIKKRKDMMDYIMKNSSTEAINIYSYIRDVIYDINEASPDALLFIKAILPKFAFYKNINIDIENSNITDKHAYLARIFNDLYEFLNNNKALYINCGKIVLILCVAIVEFMISSYSRDLGGNACVGETWLNAIIDKHNTKYNEIGMFPRGITFRQILDKINVCAVFNPAPGEI